MNTTAQIFAGASIVLSGVLAGGIVNVGLVQVPTILGLPSDAGLMTKNLLHRWTERYLPWVGRAVIPAAVVAAVATQATTSRSLLITGALCTVAVAAVSEAGNQPINRRLMAMSPEAAKRDLRPQITKWSRLNAVRLTASLAALACFTAAALVAR